MEYRPLGHTGLRVSALGFGAAPMGGEYGPIDLDEGVRTLHAALDAGVNLIDTAPYYGRGLSELLVGRALRGIARDRYLLSTKLGRYDRGHFDFSARRVRESVDVSLQRLGVDHLDLCLCHDVEFADQVQIVEETLPAMRRLQEQGKVRFVGVSAYPLPVLRRLIETAPVDVVLSYSHYTLQNDTLCTLVDAAGNRNVGIMNASPFSGGLLSGGPVPAWHKAAPQVKDACRRAAEACSARGTSLAKLALQFALRQPAFATCLVGAAGPGQVRQWADWASEPMDAGLLATVTELLRPVHNAEYVEAAS
jgi:L-galactose dehydrogenase